MAYKNISAAVFCTSGCVENLADNQDFRDRLAFLEKHIQYDKVWLETYRGFRCPGVSSLEQLIVDDKKLKFVKGLFEKKGVKTSGAITTTGFSDGGHFRSLCYSDPEHLKLLEKIVRKTAALFDEIILDDFYFTNCKCEKCIETKGKKSWDVFRREQMNSVSENIVVKAAKEVNPQVNMIIKYPNWYEHYHMTGYDTEKEPRVFDMVYTGVETRDETYTAQNTQKYLSYFLMRYLDNISKGRNGGGWLDSFDCSNKLEDYISQIVQTLSAGTREITFFCLSLLLFRTPLFVPVAGFVLEEFDRLVPELGKPQGLAAYKPYHSSGEDFLHTYIGCLGIPLEPHAEYPDNAGKVFLAESAAQDPGLPAKIKKTLFGGGSVIATSGLVKKLAGTDFAGICSVSCGDRKITADKFGIDVLVTSFGDYFESSRPVLLPELVYGTNDCFPLISAFCHENSFPFLLEDKIGKGKLYILAVPDNMGDLYRLPGPVLDKLRLLMESESGVSIKGVSRACLFVYDNDTIALQAMLPHNHKLTLSVSGKIKLLKDRMGKTELSGLYNEKADRTDFEIQMVPSFYTVFKIER